MSSLHNLIHLAVVIKRSRERPELVKDAPVGA